MDTCACVMLQSMLKGSSAMNDAGITPFRLSFSIAGTAAAANDIKKEEERLR